MTELHENERFGTPGLEEKSARGFPKKAAALSVLAALAAGTLAFAFVRGMGSDDSGIREKAAETETAFRQKKTLVLPKTPPEDVKKPAAEPEKEKETPEPRPVRSGLPAEPRKPTLTEERLASPLFAEEKTQRPAGAPAKTSAGVPPESADSAVSDSRLVPFREKKAQARFAPDPDFTVMKGEIIPCTLETALDSSVPGSARCVLPRDVYSASGRVLLLPKGTRVTGEYRGSVQHGLSRLFVLWTDASTPDGVRISLDSAASDPLGRAGVPGEADRHWWQRFGNALLFSLIGDSFQFGISRGTDASGGVNYYAGTTDSMQELIREAMKASGDIPPTLSLPEGSRVSIFLARDLGFGNVYGLKPEGGADD